MRRHEIQACVRQIIVAGGLAFASTFAQPGVVTLNFSGTYDIGGGPVFGLTGAAVPFNYSITYDTSLNTSSVHLSPGDPAGGGSVAGDDFYGYSASGIVGTSLTFGTGTWTVTDLSPRLVGTSVAADLFFNTDIALAVPTHVNALFNILDGGLLLGGLVDLGGGVVAYDSVSVITGEGLGHAIGAVTISSTSTAVPEPGSLILVATAFIALLGCRRSSRTAYSSEEGVRARGFPRLGVAATPHRRIAT